MTGLWIEGHVEPLAKLKFSLRGMRFGAPIDTGPGPGTVRGDLGVARLDYTRIPGVAVQAWGEYFKPGSFYADGSDAAWYARFQMTASF